jgi:hypothetical protein
MAMQPPTEQEFKQIVSLVKGFFKAHTIFKQPDEKVLGYLKNHAQEHEIFFYEIDGQIQAVAYLVRNGGNEEHSRWKYRHFAFISEDAGSELLKKLETEVQVRSNTAKVELTIAESEPYMDFYVSNGYVKEGELANHYRMGETCYIFGKTFS